MKGLTCREVIDFVSDYLDGALPGETLTIFEGHLAICPDCRAYIDNFRLTLKATKAAYASQDSLAIPEELVRAILASRRPS